MTKKIFNIDKAESGTVTKTAQGFLRVDGYVTRVGVLKYRTPDGKVIRQLRDPKEVMNQDSLETLRGLPVTLRHPPKLITPKDSKQYMVGYSSDDVKPEAGKLRTTLTVTDEAAIASVESGATKEISCGYECELEDTPGVYDGEQYDFVQRKIKYNHIALVEKGRAGPEVGVLMDAEDTGVYIQDDAAEIQTQKEESKMEKVMLGGKEFEVSPELAMALKEHMAAMQSEMDACKVEAKKMDEQKVAAEQMQAKMDALSADLEKAKSDLKTTMDASDDSKINERVKARIALIETAKRFIAKDSKVEEMTDSEIKKAVVKADLPSVNLDGKSDEYVSATFDYIVERTKASDDKIKDLGRRVTKATNDSADAVSADDARKKSMQLTQDAWKQPLSGAK